ncbi:MAG: PP2C family protein-serine/threonine phosphatase [Tepidisphaeraceae bacterium]
MSVMVSSFEIAEALAPTANTQHAPDMPATKPPSLLDRALGGIERMICELYESEDLAARISLLENEIELLRKRDQLLSRQMARHDEEQRLAARIQQDFLPKQLPTVGTVRFQTIYRPAQYVSGDLYDIKRLDETHVGVYLADAVGHGTPAALLTMFMKNALATKQITASGYRLLEPSETLAALNASLRGQDLAHASFATALYARIDTQKMEVCLARAGHPSPILIAADGSVTEPGADGPLLGVFDDAEFTQICFPIHSGDRLLFYTDGVETAFPRNDQPCPETWKRELQELSGRPTAELLEAFRHAIENNSIATQKDDLTMIVAEVG